MRKYYILTTIVLAVAFSSCKKEPVIVPVDTGIKSPFTVTYRLRATEQTIIAGGNSSVEKVYYDTEYTLQNIEFIHSTPVNGAPIVTLWTKTITVTRTTRPVQLSFFGELPFYKPTNLISDILINGQSVVEMTHRDYKVYFGPVYTTGYGIIYHVK